MHRNRIITICAAFCVVAMVAGLIIARLSSAGQPIAAVELAPGTVEATPVPTVDTFVSVATSAPLDLGQIPTTSAANVESDETPISLATDTVVAADSSVGSTPELPSEAPAATNAPANLAEYTIQPGDELLNIAKRYQVNMEDILAINQIDNPDSLRVGQVLRIPTQ